MALTTGETRKSTDNRTFSLFVFEKGTTMAIGNVISQTMIEHRKLIDLDLSRTFRFAAFGYFLGVKEKNSAEKKRNERKTHRI